MSTEKFRFSAPPGLTYLQAHLAPKPEPRALPDLWFAVGGPVAQAIQEQRAEEEAEIEETVGDQS